MLLQCRTRAHFAIILEAIPQQLAAIITEKLDICTVGIGAGPECSGQVLVLHDMVGLIQKIYTEIRKGLRGYVHSTDGCCITEFIKDVKDVKFPAAQSTASI